MKQVSVCKMYAHTTGAAVFVLLTKSATPIFYILSMIVPNFNNHFVHHSLNAVPLSTKVVRINTHLKKADAYYLQKIHLESEKRKKKNLSMSFVPAVIVPVIPSDKSV